MLILTRREGEAIQIGDGIRLQVTSVRDGKVRIGIEAPPDVLVLREELLPISGDQDDGLLSNCATK
ncbi:carbon storage regulator [Luteimonas viscosa]|uniref:Translational regulator CsrA n=1 Tax=Luteimonas viscosa TaxID=1132694 RepID=A0A5D4XQD6_9GAMM|nr:carbon storage regulator [Luteimonas viscosa]